MGMSDFYGPADEATSMAVLHRALDLGMNFLDTSDIYGNGANERLLSGLLANRPARWCWPPSSASCATPTACRPA